MYWIGAPFRFIYKLYFGIVYIISGVLLYPYFLIALTGKNKYKRAVFVKKIWSRVVCILCLIRVKLENKNNFPKQGPYIVIANHASYLDIILMYRIIPHDFAFLGKAELLKWPIIGIFFSRGIDIPVFRNNRKKAAQSIVQSKEAIKKGRCLAIFPEGKIPDNVPTLNRFKNGAFSLALEFNIPIVPIVFHNNYKLFSDHEDLFGNASPGVAKVSIIDSFEVDSKSNLVDLRNESFNAIKIALHET